MAPFPRRPSSRDCRALEISHLPTPGCFRQLLGAMPSSSFGSPHEGSGRFPSPGPLQNIPQGCRPSNICSRFSPSSQFPIPRKGRAFSRCGGDKRAILDLMFLIRFLWKRKFKMEIRHSIMTFLEKGDFLTSANLSEACLHVPILKKHCRFLHFSYRHLHF